MSNKNEVKTVSNNTVSTSNNFDFQAFYGMVRNIPIGLRVWIALNQLEQVTKRLSREERTLRDALESMIDELAAEEKSRKERAAKRANQGAPELLPNTDATKSGDWGKVS